MAKKAKTEVFFDDWKALSAKPIQESGKKNFNDKIEEPYKVRRKGAFKSMYPSDEGEFYAFFIVPSAEGKSFVMEDIMTIKRFKFRNPKTNEDYYENLKIPMDPKALFDMSVVKKLSEDPSSITEEDKKVLANIKRHASLVKRYKDLYWCKLDNINFKYSKNPGKYNNRIKKESLTGFFGVPTKWDGIILDNKKDYEVKFIQTRYSQFQEKFRTLLEQTSSTHDEFQPTWYEDYFSSTGGIQGVISVDMGPMKVGGRGATIKLVKVGKDPIEDRGVGISGDLDPKKIKALEGEEHSLSHLHYYMGFDSREDLWQDMYVDRFEEAIADLEGHVKEVVEQNKLNEDDPSADSSSASAPKAPF
jgi:hypothetical protein